MAAGFLALCFVYTLTGIFGSLTVLHTVARIIWSPRRALKKQRREGKRVRKLGLVGRHFEYAFNLAPPSCLLDASLGTHNYVTANGLKFHYVSAGDDSKPLMLFLHGFPEVLLKVNFQTSFKRSKSHSSSGFPGVIRLRSSPKTTMWLLLT